MNDNDVNEAIKYWAFVVADRLDVPNALALVGDVEQLVNAVKGQNELIGNLLDEFFNAYKNWWYLTNRSDLSNQEQIELINSIDNRNTTRQNLINALARV